MITFICGCTSKLEPPIDEAVFSTFDSVVLDSEGFMVCLTHHERRKGWRSLPTYGGKPDYSFADWTPLEIERFFFWNGGRVVLPLKTEFQTEDRRDNRDPAVIGAAIIAKRNGERPNHYHNVGPIPPPQTPPPGPARWGSD